MVNMIFFYSLFCLFLFYFFFCIACHCILNFFFFPFCVILFVFFSLACVLFQNHLSVPTLVNARYLHTCKVSIVMPFSLNSPFFITSTVISTNCF